MMRFKAIKGTTGCDPSPYAEEILAAKITPASLQYLSTEDLEKIKHLINEHPDLFPKGGSLKIPDLRKEVNDKYDKLEKKKYD